MEQHTFPEAAHDNAAAFWLARARALGLHAVRTAGWTAVHGGSDGLDAHRVVVTRPYSDPEGLLAELAGLFREWGTGRVCLEDPYGGLDLALYGGEGALAQAVMVREPAPLGPGSGVGPAARPGTGRGSGVEVREAVDGDGLAVAERVVVEGFPLPGRLPWRRGGLLPGALLGEPGWRAWVARRDGAPAGACVSYDDGSVVGLYWVATLPNHRSRGVARAVVEAVLAAHPGRPATLTATLLGEPLYRRLGFTERALSRWWRYPASGPAVPTAADR
ncbi:GNAT family N-acetyltransferase [Peterkaempfera bronchialis]|uniref:GNAT family N-acetyltransferase n=1 Tax=Peterkaempfera bronchialis TaxID=2126346 RepID=UPI003C2FFD3C